MRNGYNLGNFRQSIKILIPPMLVFSTLSTGFTFTLGGITLGTLKLPHELHTILSIFRSSGRFIIPVSLTLTLGILIWTRSQFRRAIAIPLAVLALSTSYVDEFNRIKEIKLIQSVENHPSPQQLFIRKILSSNKIQRIRFAVPESSAYAWKMTIIDEASLSKIPIDDYFLARPKPIELENEGKAVVSELSSFNVSPHILYVLYPSFIKNHLDLVNLLKNRFITVDFEGSLLVYLKTH
jgi:hypothetical protein